MRWRSAAVVLLVMAAALFWGVARPYEARALATADAYALAREERRAVRSRLRAVEARIEGARQAEAALGRLASSPEEAVRQVRRSAVDALEGMGVRDVRLGVRPDRNELDVRLAFTGSQASAMEAAGRLARRGTGVVLDRVTLVRRPSGVSVEVVGVAPFAAGEAR